MAARLAAALNQYLGWRKIRETYCRKLLLAWVVGWVAIAVFVLCFMAGQAAEKRRESLAGMCDERARMLQDQFNVSMNHLQALAVLVSTFHHSKAPSAIDQATFARYAERTAFERPLTSGVAYAVKVLRSERELFEQQQGYVIKKMYSSTPASGEADEYAPVIFAQEAYRHVLSYDLLTGENDRDNILRARESGKGVLTAPFELLNKRLGVILTYTVYSSELPSNATPVERINAAIGYLGGIFDIEALVDRLLHQLAGKQSIAVDVYETTNGRVTMYSSNMTGMGTHHVSPLNFGDPMRRHEMQCRFTHKAPLPWLAITTSCGMLVISLLLGHIVDATIHRIAKVEDDYHEMMELKKRAEAADVAKSQFLATVSHEIRTPMNGVLGMLQMLMDTELDSTQQDYVRTAQASGKALVTLINEVLDQAKIESGKLELEAVSFDLRAVLDDIISLFCGKAQEKGLELAAYVSEQVPETLVGDPGRMRQIITNLMGNSIKFTERGHIYLTVHLADEVRSSRADTEEAGGSSTLSGLPVADSRRSWESFRIFSSDVDAPADAINLIVSVEDTGAGIPYEAQSRMFTPFMQVRPSVSRIHGGTGIGLSISKCLVGLMKGEIGFVSKPGVGSTFTFTAVLSKPPSVGNRAEKPPPAEFSGVSALVVDHRPVRGKVALYHLKRLGVSAELATDIAPKLTGTGALDRIVLIDKETMSKEPSALSGFDKAKVFLLTRNHHEDQHGLQSITKPLRASMLQLALRRALGWAGGGTEQSRNTPSLGSLLREKHILVVDDNMVNLKVAAGALKKYGAAVTCADSGKAAVAFLKPPHKFDACFMDIQMPEMDGFEATSRVREMERSLNERLQHGEVLPDYGELRRWHTPVLAMTADVIQATYEECAKSGMDGYVSKPFEAEQLYRVVSRFFQDNGEEGRRPETSPEM